MNDHLFRSSISIYQGIAVNFTYILLRFVTAVQYWSVWFFSMAFLLIRVFNLPVGSIHILYDDPIHYKPFKISENNKYYNRYGCIYRSHSYGYCNAHSFIKIEEGGGTR